MKTHNERILKKNNEIMQKTAKLIADTNESSSQLIDRLTHPSKKVSYMGSKVGSILGGGLLIVGISECILGKKVIGVGSLIAGTTTLISNYLNIKRIDKE